VTPVFSFSLGASFNANSGTPIDALGAHPIYGDRQAFIVNRGSAGRLPWVTSLDLKLNISYRFTKDSVLTAGLEVFNIFNSQRPITVDDRYTTSSVGPIVGANNGSIPTAPQGYGAVVNTTPALGPVYNRALSFDQNVANGAVTKQPNGSLPLPAVDAGGNPIRVVLPLPAQTPQAVPINLTWGRPTAYQPVRQFRFSIRVTF
ncbi:MAG: hypothetical protein ACXWLP_09645, partial [Myxococcaceae bacterium]